MADLSPTTRRRLTALTGIGLGAALLIGGGTYALWSSTATFDVEETISTGELSLNEPDEGDIQAYDASEDRDDGEEVPILGNIKAHTINLSTWKAVPGDRVALVYKVSGTLIGDNLVASLGITALDTELANLEDLSDHVSFEYQVFNLDGTTPKALTQTRSLPTSGWGDEPLAYVQATNQGQGGANDTYTDAEAAVAGVATGTEIPLVKTGGTIEIGVVVYVTFDADVTGDLYQSESIAVLKDLSVTLTQVRDPAVSQLFKAIP